MRSTKKHSTLQSLDNKFLKNLKDWVFLWKEGAMNKIFFTPNVNICF